MKILSNGDVSEIDVAEVVSVIADAIRQSALGGLDAPARAHTPIRSARSELVFTVGATPTAVGFRVYGRAPGLTIEQATVVHDRTTGKLLGVIVGNDSGRDALQASERSPRTHWPEPTQPA